MGLIGKLVAKEKLTRPPIWLMRQAGRYMKEYRAIREKNSFLQMCKNPDLACEITLQPINEFDFDAAILFADILLLLEPMGFDLNFIEKKGPVISNPITSISDLEKLQQVDPKNQLSYVGQAVKEIRKNLAKEKDLIGFAGAPFTVASYAIEGGSTRDFIKTKKLIYQHPKVFAMLMEKITTITKDYLQMQIDNGANIIQLFDSWGGIFSFKDYQQLIHPYSLEILNFLKKNNPNIILTHFVKGGMSYLPLLKNSCADVLGIDWTCPLNMAGQLSNNEKILQGNLDPLVLLSNKQTIKEQTLNIIEQGKYLKGHIFNLGHGINKDTPIDNVKFLVDLVKSIN